MTIPEGTTDVTYFFFPGVSDACENSVVYPLGQIAFTLTRLAEIDTVVFLVEGNETSFADPVTRADFEPSTFKILHNSFIKSNISQGLICSTMCEPTTVKQDASSSG